MALLLLTSKIIESNVKQPIFAANKKYDTKQKRACYTKWLMLTKVAQFPHHSQCAKRVQMLRETPPARTASGVPRVSIRTRAPTFLSAPGKVGRMKRSQVLNRHFQNLCFLKLPRVLWIRRTFQLCRPIYLNDYNCRLHCYFVLKTDYVHRFHIKFST